MQGDNGERRRIGDGATAERRSGGAMPALVVAAIVITGLYFARPVLEPLAVAVLLSLLLSPAVYWLNHHGLGRMPAVFASVGFAFVVIIGLAAAIGEEAINLVQNLPKYEDNISAKIRSLNGVVPGAGVVARTSRVFQDLSADLAAAAPSLMGGAAGDGRAPMPVQIRTSESTSFDMLRSVVGPLLSPIASTGLVFLFVVMILLKREDLRNRVLRLAGARDLHRTTAAMNEAATRVSGYLLMQLVVGIAYGVPVGIGLAVIGIPNAPLWAIIGVAFRFIPYLGGALTAVFPIALAIAVSPGWADLAWTVLLFVAIEVIIGNVVEPWAYGRSTGLSAVAVTAAAVFWTWLWGVVGLLLATPLTVCLVVLGRHVPHLQFLDILLGNQPVLSPEETLYQRLLARDPEEATEQAEAYAKEKSIDAFFDDVALPALVMAQRDNDRGVLAAHWRGVVAEGFAAILENLADDGLVEAEATEPGSMPTVACLAGQNELDLAAAWLLQHMLRSRGHHNVVSSPDAASPFSLDRVPLTGVAVVCLPLLSTTSPARVRYLVRRLRRRVHDATIVVAFLDAAGADDPAISAIAADKAVTTFSGAIAAIEAALKERATGGEGVPARQSAG
ncbi:MAG TPA: AI-2E family transporter [Stellaceae bacterium]|jgi:predicted PurR-regulated permease PerM|nr:AI-2E family transporter [Stellaceae bacterium]